MEQITEKKKKKEEEKMSRLIRSREAEKVFLKPTAFISENIISETLTWKSQKTHWTLYLVLSMENKELQGISDLYSACKWKLYSPLNVSNVQHSFPKDMEHNINGETRL